MGGTSSRQEYPGSRSTTNRLPHAPNVNQNNRGSSTGSNTLTAQAITRPGAYSIARSSNASQAYRVQVPPNVQPNQYFSVLCGSRTVRVRCPPNTRSGNMLQITVPPENVVTNVSESVAQLTSAEGSGGGGAVAMNADTILANANTTYTDSMQTIEESTRNIQRQEDVTPPPPPQPPQAYNVVVPPGVRPHQNFPVNVNGTTIRVQCPPNARPGMTVQIRVSIPPPAPTPPPSNVQSARDLNRPPESTNRPLQRRPETTNVEFEVVVPNGATPGRPFAALAGGQRVSILCPAHARPGTRLRFTLPRLNDTISSGSGGSSSSSSNKPSTKNEKPISATQLEYEAGDGWVRSIRVTDMKFQWIRLDSNDQIIDFTEAGEAFSPEQSAFVRKLEFLKGNDDRMRTGKLSLIPASEYTVRSTIVDNDKEICNYAELAKAQSSSLADKLTWFQSTAKRLAVPWEEGHVRICVRRSHLLEDSMGAVMSLGRNDLRKTWRFDYMGEDGIDAGGLAKEWFEETTKYLMDPDFGLWLTNSAANQMQLRINPASQVSCPENHLFYFRFLGRALGKALFDGQLVKGHMAQYLYKYILGWPITFSDLEIVDAELYQNLNKLLAMKPDEIEYMCLDFTATQESIGATEQINLIPGGEDKAVTGDNLFQYLEAYLKYLLLDRIRPQVSELLLGFYDVVPETLLTIFDYQELELVMCGMPTIDLNDWMDHSLYTGSYVERGVRSKPCQWFWEVVKEDFDQEMKAKLLQFVTGTSGVPSRGFEVLQGSDGNIKKFTLHGVDIKTVMYPRAQ